MTAPEPEPEPAARVHTNASLSHLLQDFAASFKAERVRVRDITESLGSRSFGFILLIFALPNSLPMIGIPGVSAVTGLPMLIVAVQMALGYERVQLPRWVADSSIASADFRTLVGKVAPWLQRLERLMRPRLHLLTQGRAERVLGGICALLAFLLILPIPLGNLLPALSILLIALGLIESDGLCAIAGTLLGAISWLLLGGLAWVVLSTVYGFVLQLWA